MPDSESSPATEFVCGLVLAAGASARLGQPKQLLPFGGGTLLGHVLGVARSCRFDQLLCVVRPGAVADAVQIHAIESDAPGRDTVAPARRDTVAVEVIENPAPDGGCSSSIAAALHAVHPRCDVLVLMLGDQPGVTPQIVGALLAGRGNAEVAACRYDDGRGHPLAFTASVFDELRALHGDKGVWKLLDRRGAAVADVPVPGRVPRDVDTWDDYQAVSTAARGAP